MSRILIVEDEVHLANGLRFNLEAEGHQVEVAGDGELGLRLILEEKEQFDAIVLDVMLPGKDGFAVARELRRANHYEPVLMLTARGRSEDVLKGFEAGADDYLPKPFELKILLARIAGLLRRRFWTQASEAPRADAGASSSQRVEFGGKSVDFETLQLKTENQVFHLTVMEAELLRHLIRHDGQVISRKSLLEEVWGLHEDTDTRAIDNFIVRIRKYLEDVPSKPRHLLTVRGVGYKFVSQP